MVREEFVRAPWFLSYVTYRSYVVGTYGERPAEPAESPRAESPRAVADAEMQSMQWQSRASERRPPITIVAKDRSTPRSGEHNLPIAPQTLCRR